MTIDELRTKLDAGLAWAKANGVEVIIGDFGFRDQNCGCLLSCAAWAVGADSNSFNARRLCLVLGLGWDEVSGFIAGFDSDPSHPNKCAADFYALGAEYAKRVIG